MVRRKKKEEKKKRREKKVPKKFNRLIQSITLIKSSLQILLHPLLLLVLLFFVLCSPKVAL
jgi:uncharacterized membrane protein